MANIPFEIVVDEILPRLPAKSLMRFKCVSKPWLSTISTLKFINRHLQFAQSSNTNHLLVLGNDHSLYSRDLDEPESPVVKLPSFGIEPLVVGTCNGLLCIRSYRPYSLVLLNPSTGSHRKIPSLLPPRKCSAMNFGFGYDSANDDYRIVRIVDRFPSMGFLGHQMDRVVHVFSSRANSWEAIEWTSPQDSMGFRENGVLMENYLLHWKFWCALEGQYRIRSFNLQEKQWSHDVPLPNYREIDSHALFNHDNDVRDGLLDFGVLDGCLYLMTKNRLQSVVDLWIMNEYCVKESWVKMFRISDSRVLGSPRVSPIVYESLKRQILLSSVSKTEHKIWWFSIDDKTVDIARINGFEDCLWIDVCKGSLVDVPGGSQFGTIKPEDEK